MWAATGEPLAVPVAFATGVLIDSDHIFEYVDWLFKGWKRYMIVPFHAWEYSILAIIGLFFWYHPLYLAAALGHLGHVTTDHFANGGRPLTYSIIYRAYKRFSQQELMAPNPHWLSHGDKPLWAWAEPWLWKMIARRRKD